MTGRRSTISDRIHVRSEERRTAVASSFAATLELVREGKLEMRQDEVFAPLYLRGRAQGIKAVEVIS